MVDITSSYSQDAHTEIALWRKVHSRHKAVAQVTQEVKDKLDQVRDMLNYQALAKDPDFVESLEQMRRGEGRQIFPEEFESSPNEE
jgi:hypothetical protein